MSSSDALIFTISIDYVEFLEKTIAEYNKSHGTDFEIIEIIYDELTFCEIKVTRYTLSDIFDLGGVVVTQLHTLLQKGELTNYYNPKGISQNRT